LLDACWLSDTHICFNLENIEFIFSQISAGNKGTYKNKTKTDQVSAKALFSLQNQLATFDKPVDHKEQSIVIIILLLLYYYITIIITIIILLHYIINCYDHAIRIFV
jgi:hypothetical protein